MSGPHYKNRPEWEPESSERFDAERHVLAKDTALYAAEAIESGLVRCSELSETWGVVYTTLQRHIEWHLGRELVIDVSMGAKGPLNGNAKATAEEIEIIRNAPHYFSARVIRLHYDIRLSDTTIKRIRNALED